MIPEIHIKSGNIVSKSCDVKWSKDGKKFIHIKRKQRRKMLKETGRLVPNGSNCSNEEKMAWIGTKGMQGNNRNVGNKRITKISGKSVYYPKKWR